MADQNIESCIQSILKLPRESEASFIGLIEADPRPAFVSLRLFYVASYLTCMSAVFRAPQHEFAEAVAGLLDGFQESARQHGELDNDGYAHGLHRWVCEIARDIHEDLVNLPNPGVVDVSGGTALAAIMRELRNAYLADAGEGAQIPPLESMMMIARLKPIPSTVHASISSQATA
ncbi:MAG: hypothetical protein ACN6OP_13785 [Pseudomonadales bacterium]